MPEISRKTKDAMEETQEQLQVLTVLEALKEVSHSLQIKPNSNDQSIKALLELQTEDLPTKFKDPNLVNLSKHLCNLRFQVEKSRSSRGFRSFLRRRVFGDEISRVAGSIESEIQAWIDRENVESLVKVLKSEEPAEEEEQVKLLTAFESRVLQGFNRDLQDLVLKSKVFGVLESVLCNAMASERVREHCAFAMAALVRFNKDVFVGQALMGPAVQALVSMASLASIGVLCSLIRAIKSPVVDEIQSNGEIPKIIGFLDSDDQEMRVLATECVLEIGYFGRKEAIEAMLEMGLVQKLVELQRSEAGGDLIDLHNFHESTATRIAEKVKGFASNHGISSNSDIESPKSSEGEYLEKHPFTSCVARFAIQLEVGQGLRQTERAAFKLAILRKVREAAHSDAEAATIVAEVLWGSSP